MGLNISMKRVDFHKAFKTCGPAVTPVIHAIDDQQVRRNIEIVIGEGAQGAFLINHDFGVDEFLPVLRAARTAFPHLWLGVNFLAVTGKEAFPILGRLQDEGCVIDAYWADDACIDERRADNDQQDAKDIQDGAKRSPRWDGFYFGGTAFKKQREVAPKDYHRSAKLAALPIWMS